VLEACPFAFDGQRRCPSQSVVRVVQLLPASIENAAGAAR
jgi:hypothetical protein